MLASSKLSAPSEGAVFPNWQALREAINSDDVGDNVGDDVGDSDVSNSDNFGDSDDVGDSDDGDSKNLGNLFIWVFFMGRLPSESFMQSHGPAKSFTLIWLRAKPSKVLSDSDFKST